MMKKTQNILLLILLAVVVTACKKDYDSPPVKDLPAGNVLKIDSLRKMYVAVDTTITSDISVYGIVTADEVSGNLYKTLFIQDETNAIQLDLNSSSGNTFFVGDKVRVSLKGATLTRDNNMLMVTNIDTEKQIIKQDEGMPLSPEVVTITDITSNFVNGLYSPYQAKLVQINEVEFQCSEMCNTWSDAITQYSENRYLDDTLGNTVIVRTSGYASFANQPMPMGKGSIIAVVTQYGGTVQLTIRAPNELTLSGTRKNQCAFIDKDFDNQILTSCGWTTQQISGPSLAAWGIYAATNSAAKISNYDAGTSTNVACESWLISPSVNLVGTNNPDLNFRNVVRYDVLPQLNLVISTDYDGMSDPNTATWTDLTSLATWDTNPGTFSSWTSSGSINLSSYKQANVHIAFKFVGTTANSCTWEIDDIQVQDN